MHHPRLETPLHTMPPIHPGEILLTEFMEPLEVSQHQLALATRIPISRINAIVKGKRAITADTALRFGRYFGTSPDLWLGLQMDYDLAVQRDVLADRLDREVRPLRATG